VAESIYFLKSFGAIKIGYSADVATRIRDISIYAPLQPDLLGTIPGDRHFERAIHGHLKKHHLKGEWFSDCSEVREVMARLFEVGAAAINFVPPTPTTRREGAIARVIRVMREKYPQRTAAELSTRTGATERTAGYWLSGRCNMSAENLANLLQSEDGFLVLEAIMGDSKLEWWRKFKRQMELAAARRDLESAQARLAKVKRDDAALNA